MNFWLATHINRGSYRLFEAKIYACITDGVSGSLTWSFHYATSEDTRPDAVHYIANFSSGCDSLNEEFQNPLA